MGNGPVTRPPRSNLWPGAIGRVIDKLAEVGPAYFLTLARRRLLPPRCFDRSRLIMLELALPVSAPAPIPGGKIRWAEEREHDLLGAFGHTRAILRRRFADGDRPCVLVLGDRLAGYAWFRVGVFDEEQLGARFRMAPGEVWLYDGMVAPDLRGRGLYANLVKGAGVLLAAEGFSRMLIQVEVSNRNGFHGHRAAGARPIASYQALRLCGRTRFSDHRGTVTWVGPGELHVLDAPRGPERELPRESRDP